MALHEKMKTAKIIEDIFLFLFSNNINKASLSVDIKADMITFIVSLHEKNSEFIDILNDQLFCNRDYSVEEYGWEIMFEDDTSLEIEQIGLHIDSFEIIETDTEHQILFYRKL